MCILTKKKKKNKKKTIRVFARDDAIFRITLIPDDLSLSKLSAVIHFFILIFFFFFFFLKDVYLYTNSNPLETIFPRCV